MSRLEDRCGLFEYLVHHFHIDHLNSTCLGSTTLSQRSPSFVIAVANESTAARIKHSGRVRRPRILSSCARAPIEGSMEVRRQKMGCENEWRLYALRTVWIPGLLFDNIDRLNSTCLLDTESWLRIVRIPGLPLKHRPSQFMSVGARGRVKTASRAADCPITWSRLRFCSTQSIEKVA